MDERLIQCVGGRHERLRDGHDEGGERCPHEPAVPADWESICWLCGAMIRRAPMGDGRWRVYERAVPDLAWPLQ